MQQTVIFIAFKKVRNVSQGAHCSQRDPYPHRGHGSWRSSTRMMIAKSCTDVDGGGREDVCGWSRVTTKCSILYIFNRQFTPNGHETITSGWSWFYQRMLQKTERSARSPDLVSVILSKFYYNSKASVFQNRWLYISTLSAHICQSNPDSNSPNGV